jgi:hypothetical protein
MGLEYRNDMQIPQFDQPDHRLYLPKDPHKPRISKSSPKVSARKSVRPKIFRTIAAKSGKTPGFAHITDGAHAPAQNPARPIEPGSLALKFLPRKIFRIESSRAEKFSARNLKILKIFGLKVEKSKKFPVESWKKRC